jgi:hypothetical protein
MKRALRVFLVIISEEVSFIVHGLATGRSQFVENADDRGKAALGVFRPSVKP